MDGDGHLDALIGNDDQNRVYLNDGTGDFADATAGLPADSDDTRAVALGDVDGDGDLDALLGNSLIFSIGAQNRLYLNDGTGAFVDATASLPTGSYRTQAVALGDLDADGDLDALIGNDHGQNRLFLNVGSGVFADATASLPADSDHTQAVALGDVDGDGDLDALIGNSYGQNRLFLNVGSGVFADATASLPADFDSAGAVALGDVDGDGDLDALIGNSYAGCNRLCSNLTRQLVWRGIPRIGEPLVMDLYGTHGGAWFLAWALDSGEVPVPPLGTAKLDPFTVKVADIGLLDGSGFDTAQFPIPDNPALVGFTLHWQALLGGPLMFSNREMTTFTGL